MYQDGLYQSQPQMLNMGGVYATLLNYNAALSNNDPSIMCINGNSYSIKMKGDQIQAQSSSHQIRSLRVCITGTLVQTFNLCCWITTIIFGSIFIFPLFFICCDWWKRVAFQKYQVTLEAYLGICQLIKATNAQQLYIIVQDNFFDKEKADLLIQAISRSRLRNIQFINIAMGFNSSKGSNYVDFVVYMKPIYNYVKNGQIRWGNSICMK